MSLRTCRQQGQMTPYAIRLEHKKNDQVLTYPGQAWSRNFQWKYLQHDITDLGRKERKMLKGTSLLQVSVAADYDHNVTISYRMHVLKNNAVLPYNFIRKKGTSSFFWGGGGRGVTPSQPGRLYQGETCRAIPSSSGVWILDCVLPRWSEYTIRNPNNRHKKSLTEVASQRSVLGWRLDKTLHSACPSSLIWTHHQKIRHSL